MNNKKLRAYLRRQRRREKVECAIEWAVGLLGVGFAAIVAAGVLLAVAERLGL